MTQGNTNGLDGADKARYQHKLVGADLAAEQARAQALAKEANAERAEAPVRAAHLAAVAKDRLGLIDAEIRNRGVLEKTLSDGTPAETFAKSLEGLSTADLAAQAKALKGAAGPDAVIKRRLFAREHDRRAGAAEAKQAQAEKSRLDAVKAAYGEQLEGKAPAALEREQKLEDVRVDAAQAEVKAAKDQLATADTAGERARAKSALKLGERQLRTEYARNAVLNAQDPNPYDHRAMHAYGDAQKGKSEGGLQAERQKVEAEYNRLTTGGIRGSREEVANARVKLAILDQAIAKATGKPVPPIDGPKGPPPLAPAPGVQPPKDGHPAAGAQVFKEPGVFVANSDAFPADIAIPKMKAAGVKWCALQIANGSTVDDETQRHLQMDFIKRCHDAGIKVGFWGYLQTDPVSDAKTVAKQIKDWGADFYVANPELEYKYTSADGSPDPEAYARSQKFVDAFRAELPDFPAAVTSYGRYDKADLDWKAWQKAGFDAIPEAFLNEQPDWDPKSTVEGAEKVGWSKDRIHPLFGLWGGGQRGLVSADAYVDNMRQSGATGFSSYLAEQMSEEDWAGLKRGIEAGDPIN